MDEFAQFPNGEHDDAVDSCSQALSWMLFSSGATGIPMTAEQKLLDQAIRSERNMFTSPALYDVYGARDIY